MTTTQKRNQMREDLARAMGWVLVNWSWVGNNRECQAAPPDPFTNAADNRALVEWLADQPCTDDYQDHECYEDGLCFPFGRFIEELSDHLPEGCLSFTGYKFEASLRGLCKLMTLDFAVIAEAAWQAIQSEASDDKSSQSKAHVQPCPCAWCRVDRANATIPARAEKKGPAID